MNAPFEMLLATAGATACWILWFYFFRGYRVDAFRNELFRLRDELFNLALSGEISFESRPYIELRYSINGMIRFAHRLNSYSLYLASRLKDESREEQSPYDSWEASLTQLPAETAQKLIQIHEQMTLAAVRHLILGSISLAVFSIFVFAQVIWRGLKQVLDGRRKWQEASGRTVGYSVIRRVARSIPTAALEEEAYREGIRSPKPSLA